MLIANAKHLHLFKLVIYTFVVIGLDHKQLHGYADNMRFFAMCVKSNDIIVPFCRIGHIQ